MVQDWEYRSGAATGETWVTGQHRQELEGIEAAGPLREMPGGFRFYGEKVAGLTAEHGA
jgi:hypothetical protein